MTRLAYILAAFGAVALLGRRARRIDALIARYARQSPEVQRRRRLSEILDAEGV